MLLISQIYRVLLRFGRGTQNPSEAIPWGFAPPPGTKYPVLKSITYSRIFRLCPETCPNGTIALGLLSGSGPSQTTSLGSARNHLGETIGFPPSQFPLMIATTSGHGA